MATLPLLIMALLQCPPPADYVAGVSQDGWAVAPADLPSDAPSIIGDVQLNLELPASDYTQNDLLQKQFPYAPLDVGDLTVTPQGDVSLNGAPLDQRAECP